MSRRFLFRVLFLFALVTPAFASAQATPDAAVQAVEEQVFEVEGSPLVLAPDGSALAGTSPDDRSLCVWDTATLEPTCSDPLRGHIDHESVTWAPDSTAIAFSEDTLLSLRDSDVYVFEVADGTMANLTDDGDVELDMMGGQEQWVDVDLYPSWSPDAETLVFARSTIDDSPLDEAGTSLMTIPRAGGEPEAFAADVSAEAITVADPPIWREDGSLLFTMWSADRSSPLLGVWQVAQGGEPEMLLPGTFDDEVVYPELVQLSPDGTQVSLLSVLYVRENMGDKYWTLDLDTGTVADHRKMFGLDSTQRMMSPTVFSPDGALVAFVLADLEAGASSLVVGSLDTGEMTEITALDNPPTLDVATAGMGWATNGTIFVPTGRDGGVLVTVETGS